MEIKLKVSQFSILVDPKKIVISSNILHKGFRHPRCFAIDAAMTSAMEKMAKKKNAVDVFSNTYCSDARDIPNTGKYLQCWGKNKKEEDTVYFCNNFGQTGVDIKQTSRFYQTGEQSWQVEARRNDIKTIITV